MQEAELTHWAVARGSMLLVTGTIPSRELPAL